MDKAEDWQNQGAVSKVAPKLANLPTEEQMHFLIKNLCNKIGALYV